jgi:DNA-binding CsgD family transcriptional regulator
VDSLIGGVKSERIDVVQYRRLPKHDLADDVARLDVVSELLGPEGAVVVEGGDALGRPCMVWTVLCRDPCDEVEDGGFRRTVVPGGEWIGHRGHLDEGGEPEHAALMNGQSFDIIREVLEAGARGFLLKSDAKALLVSAVKTQAAHKPFFTGMVSEALLEAYLSKGNVVDSALTAREKAVVQLIAEGKTNKQIADILSISIKTVETHRALALRKLNLDTTAALIRYAIRNGLVEA